MPSSLRISKTIRIPLPVHIVPPSSPVIITSSTNTSSVDWTGYWIGKILRRIPFLLQLSYLPGSETGRDQDYVSDVDHSPGHSPHPHRAMRWGVLTEGRAKLHRFTRSLFHRESGNEDAHTDFHLRFDTVEDRTTIPGSESAHLPQLFLTLYFQDKGMLNACLSPIAAYCRPLRSSDQHRTELVNIFVLRPYFDPLMAPGIRCRSQWFWLQTRP